MSNPKLSTFDTVATKAHEKWLFDEAQEMLKTPGLGAEKLCSWQGSFFRAFGLEPKNERPQSDWGLSAPGEHEEQALPCILIQSCWSHEYNMMFEEMEKWMRQTNGVLQVAILCKWNIDFSDIREPVLEGEIQVFTYAPGEQHMYRGPIIHEKVRSDEPEVRELPSVKVTTRELFGINSRGRNAAYALSLTELWYTALELFDEDVEYYWAAQENETIEASGKGKEEPEKHDIYHVHKKAILGQNQISNDEFTVTEHASSIESESEDFSAFDQSDVAIGIETEIVQNLAMSKVRKISINELPVTRNDSEDDIYNEDIVEDHSELHSPGLATLDNLDNVDRAFHKPNEVIDGRITIEVGYQAKRGEDIADQIAKDLHSISSYHSTYKTTHSSSTHKEIQNGQDSSMRDPSSLNARSPEFNVKYDQNSIPQQTASINVKDTPTQCPHCSSENCCYGTDSPFRNLPENFMSAGVLGPYSWCGFVVHITLSTMTQPVAQDVLETSRDRLVRQIHECTEARLLEIPPENVSPSMITTINAEKTAITTSGGLEQENMGAEKVVHNPHSIEHSLHLGPETSIILASEGPGGLAAEAEKVVHNPHSAEHILHLGLEPSIITAPEGPGGLVAEAEKVVHNPHFAEHTLHLGLEPSIITAPEGPGGLVAEAEKVVHNPYSVGHTLYPVLETSSRGTKIPNELPETGMGESRAQSLLTGIRMRDGLGHLLEDIEKTLQNTPVTQSTHGAKSTDETTANAVEEETTKTSTQWSSRGLTNNFLGIDERTGTQTVDAERSITLTETEVVTPTTEGTTTKAIITHDSSTVEQLNLAKNEPEQPEEESDGESSSEEGDVEGQPGEPKFKSSRFLGRTFRGSSATSLAGSLSSVEKGRRRRDKVIEVVTKAIERVGDTANNISNIKVPKITRGRKLKNKLSKNAITGTSTDTLENDRFGPLRPSLPISSSLPHEDPHPNRYSKDSGIDITSIHNIKQVNSKMSSDFGAESGEDFGSGFKGTDGEEFGKTHEFIAVDNNSTTANTTTIAKSGINNRGTEDAQGFENTIHQPSTGLESLETASVSGIGSKVIIAHQVGCKYSESSGSGSIQCECAGTDLITRQAAQAPAPATSTADPAALYAQLQAIMNQIYSQTGQLVVPKVNTSVACEIVEVGKEEVVVEVDVRVTYKSSKALEHVGVCSQARQVLGAGEKCPILEEMEARS